MSTSGVLWKCKLGVMGYDLYKKKKETKQK